MSPQIEFRDGKFSPPIDADWLEVTIYLTEILRNGRHAVYDDCHYRTGAHGFEQKSRDGAWQPVEKATAMARISDLLDFGRMSRKRSKR